MKTQIENLQGQQCSLIKALFFMRAVALIVTVISAGCFASITWTRTAQAVLMPDAIVDSGGVLNDAPYRDLGTQLTHQGKLLCLTVLVPGFGIGRRDTSAAFFNSLYALTAAHNVVDLLRYNPRYEISTGNNYLTNRGTVYQVESVTVYPGFDGTKNTPDIAIIKFAQPILEFQDNVIGAASAGDVLTSGGFGSYGTPSFGRIFPHNGAARGWQAKQWEYDPSGSDTSPVYYRSTIFGFFNDGITINGMGLEGDSGGPVYNAAGELVGLTTASTGIAQNGQTVHLQLDNPQVYSWIQSMTVAPRRSAADIVGGRC